jgi:hypothetical protein
MVKKNPHSLSPLTSVEDIFFFSSMFYMERNSAFGEYCREHCMYLITYMSKDTTCMFLC